MNDDRVLDYAGEFKEGGLLERFYRTLEEGKPVDMQKLLRELLVQDTIAGITLEFEEKEMVAKL